MRRLFEKIPKLLIFIFPALILVASCTTVSNIRIQPPYDRAVYSPEWAGRIESGVPVGAEYMGVCLDASLVFGSGWWEGSGGMKNGVGTTPAEPLDLSDSDLIRYAAALGEGLLRIGGSDADKLFYDPENKSEEFPEGYSLRLTGKRWRQIIDFCRAASKKLVFTVNAGPGPRPGGTDDSEKTWRSTNALELIRHADSRRDPVSAWEFGNELNGYAVIHGPQWRLSGEQIARDFRTFTGAVKSVNSDYMIIGPSAAHWPVAGEMLPFTRGFLEPGPEGIDAVSFHYYPQQSERGGIFRTRAADAGTMLDEANLNDILHTIEYYRSMMQKYGITAQLWLGETGNAQFGGQKGVSDTFLSSLWWIDLLSLSAHSGVSRVMRQTLTGSDYGMLDSQTLRPRPDYWTSCLWNQSVRGWPARIQPNQANGTAADGEDGLRLWGFDNLSEQWLVAVNLNRNIEIELITDHMQGEKSAVLAEATGKYMEGCTWNGKAPGLNAAGTAVLIPWKKSGDSILLPPLSFAVIRIIQY